VLENWRKPMEPWYYTWYTD